MSKWKIAPPEYFRRLDLDPKQFLKQLHLPDIEGLKNILPLRDMAEVHSLIPMRLEMLQYLVKRIKTLGNQPPFENSAVKMIKLDPRQLKVGQRYVYRETYQGLLEGIPDIFNKFLVNNGGLSDLGPYFVFGTNGDGQYAMACYLPPLVEKHGLDLVIMDGIHRNYIVRQTGATLNAILIDAVSAPFPCAVEEWSETTIIPLKDKPERLEDRYFELHKELFRDLKHLGIDG